MRAPKHLVLSVVVKSYEATGHWVTVPDDLLSKAKALMSFDIKEDIDAG